MKKKKKPTKELRALERMSISDANQEFSVLQNDVHGTSRYSQILMDGGARALIIHDTFVQIKECNNRKFSVNK